MPNKAHSKAQFRMLKGVAEGTIPAKGKLTPDVAEEMLGGQTPAGLPERIKPKKAKRTWRFR